MSEGKQYIPDQFAGREFKAASVTQAKVSTKLYKTSSSDPASTDDTGLGYAVGTIWTNTTSGQIFIATDVTAENASWRGQEGDDINLLERGSNNYAGIYGGQPSRTNVDRYSVTSPGDASDVGEASPRAAGSGSQNVTGILDTTNCFILGGRPANNTVDKFAHSSSVSVSDHGEMNTALYNMGAGQSKTECFAMGGNTGSLNDTIQKFAFAAPLSAADTSSELSAARDQFGGHSDLSGGYIYAAGGLEGSAVDTIERFPTSSPYPVADYGELSMAKRSHSSCDSPTHGYTMGVHDAPGTNTDRIDRFPFSSPVSTDDVGNLATHRQSSCGAASPSKGFAAGGYSNDYHNQIESWTLSSSADASDWGDLAATVSNMGAWQSN